MPKYDKVRKWARDEKIVEYHLEHPEMSLQEIGDMWNLTPQRVWQILHDPEKVKGRQGG